MSSNTARETLVLTRWQWHLVTGVLLAGNATIGTELCWLLAFRAPLWLFAPAVVLLGFGSFVGGLYFAGRHGRRIEVSRRV